MKTYIFSQKEEFMSSVSCFIIPATLFMDQGGLYAPYSNVPAIILPGLLFPSICCIIYQIRCLCSIPATEMC